MKRCWREILMILNIRNYNNFKLNERIRDVIKNGLFDSGSGQLVYIKK